MTLPRIASSESIEKLADDRYHDAQFPETCIFTQVGQ